MTIPVSSCIEIKANMPLKRMNYESKFRTGYNSTEGCALQFVIALIRCELWLSTSITTRFAELYRTHLNAPICIHSKESVLARESWNELQNQNGTQVNITVQKMSGYFTSAPSGVLAFFFGIRNHLMLDFFRLLQEDCTFKWLQWFCSTEISAWSQTIFQTGTQNSSTEQRAIQLRQMSEMSLCFTFLSVRNLLLTETWCWPCWFIQ